MFRKPVVMWGLIVTAAAIALDLGADSAAACWGCRRSCGYGCSSGCGYGCGGYSSYRPYYGSYYAGYSSCGGCGLGGCGYRSYSSCYGGCGTCSAYYATPCAQSACGAPVYTAPMTPTPSAPAPAPATGAPTTYNTYTPRYIVSPVTVVRRTSLSTTLSYPVVYQPLPRYRER